MLAGVNKQTEYVSDTLTPIFNETLYFELKNKSATELEQTIITLNLYDHNSLAIDSYLGSFTVDAAYIYQMNADHELYRKWVVLTDTTDATEGTKGYLKVTINVLGPGDRPPVHDNLKDLKNKDDNDVDDLFSPGHVDRKEIIIKFNVIKAEHLVPMDWHNESSDPYLKVAFAGVGIRTKTVEDNLNPIFDTQLQIPLTLPCLNRNMRCEIWDDDSMRPDERIGTFFVPFPTKEENRVKQEARWANMYGPLPKVTGK